MILDETAALLRRLLGKDLSGLRVERAVVGVYFSAVKLSDGSGGMASTPPDLKAAHRSRRGGNEPGRKPPPGALAGLRAAALLEEESTDPVRYSLKVAALAALSSRFLTAKRYKLFPGRDALDLLGPFAGARVVMVGAFTSYIKRLKKARAAKISVLELNRQALATGDRKYFAPAAKAAQVMKASDIIIITGASITNGTVDPLLRRLPAGAKTAIVGPTGSFLPDAFFEKGVTMVSGAQIYDADRALDLLSQGARAHHLYGTCARKINLLPL